jgi:hypothetical protein
VAPNEQENTRLSTERGLGTMSLLQAFFCEHKRIISAVKRVESVSDRMSCIILRGRWCQIVVLNVQAPTKVKTIDVKDSLY